MKRIKEAVDNLEALIKKDEDAIGRIKTSKVVDEQNNRVPQPRLDMFISQLEESISWKKTCIAALTTISKVQKDVDCGEIQFKSVLEYFETYKGK